MAEYRELPRVFGYARKLQEKGTYPSDIPAKFTFGHGHIKFFVNKLNFVRNRYHSLVDELKARGFNINYACSENLTEGLDKTWFGDYTPSEDEIQLSQDRINEKIRMKPDWYRKTRKNEV